MEITRSMRDPDLTEMPGAVAAVIQAAHSSKREVAVRHIRTMGGIC